MKEHLQEMIIYKKYTQKYNQQHMKYCINNFVLGFYMDKY
jgi:hypothetical protein